MVLSSDRSKGVFLLGLGVVTISIGVLIYKSFDPRVGNVLSLPVFVIGGLFSISGIVKLGRAFLSFTWGNSKKKEEDESRKYMLEYFTDNKQGATKKGITTEKQAVLKCEVLAVSEV